MERTNRLAVLIDADNAQAITVDALMAEIANYGYVKLGELVQATKLFETEERIVGEGNSKANYIRDMRRR